MQTDRSAFTPVRAMKKPHVLLALLAAFAASLVVPSANAQIGGAAVIFLQIEPDSRVAGMGNAGVAVADNGYATFWNPAGLGFQRGTELSITHSEWLPEFNAGLFYEYVIVKHHLERWGTFGAHLQYRNLGRHEGRDAQNNPTEEFSSYDLAVGVSYGKQFGEHLSLGTSFRYIHSSLATGQAVQGAGEAEAGRSFGVDLAALYRSPAIDLGGTPTTISAGFNLANVGPAISYTNTPNSDPIPTTLRFGYAVTFDFDQYNKLTLANDFTKSLYKINVDGDSTYADPVLKALFSSWSPITVRTNAASDEEAVFETLSVLDQLVIGAGAEYWYNNLFALRGGYFYENPYNGNRQFLTFGAGLRYNIVGVDFSYIYALEEQHPLANTMRFSLLVNFGE
jgi:opacity protein-like surface antigen